MRSLDEWVGKTDDSKWTKAVERRKFKEAGGRCQGPCQRVLRPGYEWDLDHIRAIADGGENRESNLQVLCSWCHGEKTSEENSERAKVNRKFDSAHGIDKKRKKPWPLTRLFKRKVSVKSFDGFSDCVEANYRGRTTMLRRKPEPSVEIIVPSVDPAEEVVKGMDVWRSSANALLSERNAFKERCEYLITKLEVLQQTSERLEHEHQSARNEIAAEREYWRKLALDLLHANADLRNTVNGVMNFLRMADNTLRHTEALQKQMKVEPQPQPELLVDFDKNGIPQNAPPIDLDGVKQLSEQLAKLQ